MKVPMAAVQAQSESSFLRSLPGGEVIWLVVLLELLTFALFFLAFADSHTEAPDIYAQSQAKLHVGAATINTAILLIASWAAARAVLAHEQPRKAGWFWVIAAVVGTGFMGIKSAEYISVFGDGIRLSTNSFWFYYLFLTFMHYLHVLAGIGFAVAQAWRHLKQTPMMNKPGAEATAVYWHLVDLIWIVLFPLTYLAS